MPRMNSHEKQEEEKAEKEDDPSLLGKVLLQQGSWCQRECLAGGGFQKLAQDLEALFSSLSLCWHTKTLLVCLGTDTMI